jgi:hypothetical protein
MWNRHNEEDMLDLLKRCAALCRTQSYGGQLDTDQAQDAPLLKKSALTGEASLHEAALLIGIGLGNIHVAEDVTDLMRYPRATLTPLDNHWGILNMVSCLWSDLSCAYSFKLMTASTHTREVMPCMHHYLAGAEPLAFDAQNTAAIRDAILLAYGGILALEEAGVKRKGLDYWSWLATAMTII